MPLQDHSGIQESGFFARLEVDRNYLERARPSKIDNQPREDLGLLQLPLRLHYSDSSLVHNVLPQLLPKVRPDHQKVDFHHQARSNLPHSPRCDTSEEPHPHNQHGQ
jgi:hypothetical protein